MVLAFILLGIWIMPLLYVATDWLDGFDYRLPDGLSLVGVGVFSVGLWLRYRAQKDLDDNWSPSLVIWQSHELVTEGIYGWMRHPLYAALVMWGLAQPLLLQNWIAGFAGLLAAGSVVLIRLPREEKMLENHFGVAYEEYRQRTGAIFPRPGKFG
jgi:protein-S-isoprenylcysteine O-methyltransferase Ste14